MNSSPELLPTKSVFEPGDDVEVEVRGLREPATLSLWRLGGRMTVTAFSRPGAASMGSLAAGGYGVELTTSGGDLLARTALDVRGDSDTVQRYGFVADYTDGRDTAGFSDNLRRLHLTDVQFYDWAFRHANLLGGGEHYLEALGRPISLPVVRELLAAARTCGTRSLGYAAVYAVGAEDWPAWSGAALLDGDLEPYRLAEILQIIDPAEPGWLEHLRRDLRSATDRLGFDGFHLDQYGYPKYAVRRDGTVVDLAESFAALIDGIRSELPHSRLIFNQVNDFPTWRTAALAQDAVYIEPWRPSLTLGHLAGLVDRAHTVGGAKPVVIAAYQSVYGRSPAWSADLATCFTMATLASHGATQLLCGDADRILIDPYYVHNHLIEPTTGAMLRRWYDFIVEHTEVLFDAAADITAAFGGSLNDDLDVTYDEVEISETAVPGTIWRRIVKVGGFLVIHLINLSGQTDTDWDSERCLPLDTGVGTLRIRRIAHADTRVWFADPDRNPRLRQVPTSVSGQHLVATLPAPHVWQMVVLQYPGGSLADPQ